MSTEKMKLAREMMLDTVDITKIYIDMEQSKAYAEFRPRYTDELFKTFVDYCKEINPNLNLAVDVGCKPGTWHEHHRICQVFQKGEWVWYHAMCSGSFPVDDFMSHLATGWI